MQSAFNIKIDQKSLQKQTKGYMGEISNSITTDIAPAKKKFDDGLSKLSTGVFNSIKGNISVNDIDKVVNNSLKKSEVNKITKSLEKEYVIPKDTFKTAYAGLLKGLLQVYITSYYIK